MVRAVIEPDGDSRRVAVYESFAVKDALKGAGYRFDGTKKVWWKPLEGDSTVEELQVRVLQRGGRLRSGAF